MSMSSEDECQQYIFPWNFMVASALMGVEQLFLALPIIENKHHRCSITTVKWYKLGILTPHASDIPGCVLTASCHYFSLLSSWCWARTT